MSEFSDEFKANVNVLSNTEKPKFLLEITHPALPEALRLINDNCDLVSNGNTYVAFPFRIDMPSDVENELSKLNLRVQNIGRELVKWVEMSYGANRALVKVSIVRRVEPDKTELLLPAYVARTVISAQEVSFDLIIAKNNFTQRGTRFVFSKAKTPGIF